MYREVWREGGSQVDKRKEKQTKCYCTNAEEERKRFPRLQDRSGQTGNPGIRAKVRPAIFMPMD